MSLTLDACAQGTRYKGYIWVWSSFDDTPGPAILSSCSELLLNGGLFYAVLVEIEKPKLLQ